MKKLLLLLTIILITSCNSHERTTHYFNVLPEGKVVSNTSKGDVGNKRYYVSIQTDNDIVVYNIPYRYYRLIYDNDSIKHRGILEEIQKPLDMPVIEKTDKPFRVN